MLRAKKILLMALFIGLIPLSANAGNSDTTSVSFDIQAINELTVNNASVTLTISSALAGSQPNNATTTASYNITTNCTANSKKLTGAINSDMPSEVSLQVQVAAPSGATSLNYVSMSVTAADVVTGIDATAAPNLQIDFKMTANVSAGVVTSATRTLTLTLTDAI
jgi:hypothetical protein